MQSLTNIHLGDPSIRNARTVPTVEQFLKVLNVEEIDLAELRQLSFRGIPDEPHDLRSIVWRILLDYLPLRPGEWEAELQRLRGNYEIFKSELMVVPDIEEEADHPLAMDSGSKWNIYFKDQETWDSIDKDIKRTRMDMHFFLTPTDSSLTYEDMVSENYPKRQYARPYVTGFVDSLDETSDPFFNELMKNENIEKRADVIGRVLFVYSKLNPGINYVQGMNELLAPIYYLFAHEKHALFKGSAEADSFYCFTTLMSKVRDTFVGSLDSSESGLAGQLNKLSRLIERFDYDVYCILEELEVSPFYYAMKWIVLLMSQELALPDLFRLWDCLLAEDEPFEFLRYVCLSMILGVRHIIIEGDFATILKAIQNPEYDNINDLIIEAEAYYRHDRTKHLKNPILYI